MSSCTRWRAGLGGIRCRGYGTPFYALSWSFVDYLVERDGLPKLRVLVDDPQHIASRKQEWLLRLQAGTAAGTPQG